MELKTKRKIAKILRKTGYVLAIIGIILISIAEARASHYSEMKAKGRELGSIENIDNYLNATHNQTFHHHMQDLNKYWETRNGDCTELSRLKKIMYNSIKIRARLVHGYQLINNSYYKHDYVEYYDQGWHTTEKNTIKRGNRIW